MQYFLVQNCYLSNSKGILYICVYMYMCVHVCVYAFAGIFSLFDFFVHGHILILSLFFHFIYLSRKKKSPCTLQ